MSAETFPKRIRKFLKPPENCPSEILEVMENLIMFQTFLERLIFKWNVDIIMEFEGAYAFMYIENRKQLIGACLPLIPNESLYYLECRLSASLFSSFQSAFRHHQVISTPYLTSQRHADIVADYCVNYLVIMETLDSVGRRDALQTAIHLFWTLYEDHIAMEIEMNDAPRRPPNLKETPLHQREVDFCVFFEELAKATGQEAEKTVEIFDQGDFSFPFKTSPMAKTILNKFFYCRAAANVSANVKTFLGEIRRVFATEIQLERIYKRKAEGYGYEDFFVLSLVNLEWLAKAEGRCEFPNRTSDANIRKVVRDLESSLSYEFFDLVTSRLNMPASIDIENYDKESCKEFGRIAASLIDILDLLRLSEDVPEGKEFWDTEVWEEISASKWEEEIENSTKIRDISKKTKDRVKTPKVIISKAATSRKSRKRKHSESTDDTYLKNWLNLKVGERYVTVTVQNFNRHFKRGTPAARKKICRFVEEIIEKTGRPIRIVQNFTEKKIGGEIWAGFSRKHEAVGGEKDKRLWTRCRASDLTDDFPLVAVNIFRMLEEKECITEEGRTKVIKKKLADIEDVINEAAALVKQKM